MTEESENGIHATLFKKSYHDLVCMPFLLNNIYLGIQVEGCFCKENKEQQNDEVDNKRTESNS